MVLFELNIYTPIYEKRTLKFFSKNVGIVSVMLPISSRINLSRFISVDPIDPEESSTFQGK